MFCPNCGKQLQDGTPSCPYCGEAFYPAQTPPPAPKKKRRTGLWIALAVILVVVIGGGVFAATRISSVSNLFLRTFASPERYYQYVVAKNTASFAENVSAFYGNSKKNLPDMEDVSVNGSVRVDWDDGLPALLGLAADYDLSWLKSAEGQYVFSRSDEQMDLDLDAYLNGSELARLNLALNTEEEALRFSLPQFVTGYAETDVSSYFDDIRYETGMDVQEMLEMSSDVLQALPDQKLVQRVLSRYLLLLSEAPGSVDKSKDTLKTAKVSADYTSLKLTIREKDLRKAVENICDTILDDDDLETLLEDVEDITGQTGLYDSMIDEVETLADHVDDITLDEKVNVNLWVDGSGTIRGFRVNSGDTKVVLAAPEKGGKQGLEISIESDGDSVLFTGSRAAGSKGTGEYTLEVNDTEYLFVTVEALDTASLREGNYDCKLILTPTRELLLEADVDSSMARSLEKFSLSVEANKTGNESGLRLGLIWDEDQEYFSIAMNAEVGQAGDMHTGSAEPVEDWLGRLSEADAASQLSSRLRSAGVPNEYADQVEQMLSFYLMMYS